jgi:hypothetical protein
MGRYRKIDPRIWGDQKFKALSKPRANGQTLWFYLLTGPHTSGCPGLYHLGELGLAESLGWPLKGFREAFRELLREGLVKADWSAHVVAIFNVFKKYDTPDNPNVIKFWGKCFDEIPECSLKVEYYKELKLFLEGYGEGFKKGFLEGFGKGYGESITITIPEPEPFHNQNTYAPSDPQKGSLEAVLLAHQEIFEKAYPGINLENETAKAKAWLESNPKNRKSNLKRFLNNWFNREQDRVNRFPPREEKFL